MKLSKSLTVNKHSIFFSLTLALAMSTACVFAQQVTVDLDHKADFSHYSTFSLYKLQALNPLVEQRLRNDLTKYLTARGVQMMPEGGELAITAIGSRRNTTVSTRV